MDVYSGEFVFDLTFVRKRERENQYIDVESIFNSLYFLFKKPIFLTIRLFSYSLFV